MLLISLKHRGLHHFTVVQDLVRQHLKAVKADPVSIIYITQYYKFASGGFTISMALRQTPTPKNQNQSIQDCDTSLSFIMN